METIFTHLRNKMLAGALAAVPIVILIVAGVWLEQHTRPLTQPLGFHIPGLGILLAVVAIYALGLIVTSIVGKFFLKLFDKVLQRVPGLSPLYRAFKDVLVTSPDHAGIFDRVVLAPNPEGQGTQLAFTYRDQRPAKDVQCVFLPGAPNPLAGRLILVDPKVCPPLPISVEDAFKFLLSTGNFLPDGLQ